MRPKRMNAKYPGTCRTCGESFYAGDAIVWAGRGQCHHAGCFEGATAPVRQSRRQREEAQIRAEADHEAFQREQEAAAMSQVETTPIVFVPKGSSLSHLVDDPADGGPSFCGTCGDPVDESGRFCGTCGDHLPEPPTEPDESDCWDIPQPPPQVSKAFSADLRAWIADQK